MGEDPAGKPAGAPLVRTERSERRRVTRALSHEGQATAVEPEERYFSNSPPH